MTGTDANLTPLLMVMAVLTAFVLVGLRQRARELGAYGLAGRSIGTIGGGAAIASNWMSAASFLGLAGLLYVKGYFALAYVIGWTGGYVLLLVLMAGQIRRFGKHTAPEFVGDRYDSDVARLISALVSIAISVIYCVAQFKGIGLVFAWLFGVEYAEAVMMGGAAVISYIVICGILGVARNQQMQYFILIVSFIAPLMVIARKLGFFWFLPQFGYGAALQQLPETVAAELTAPFASASIFEWVSVCFTLMVGTAGLPHVLTRFYVVPNLRDARWSVAWGLFFIALIYWSAPAYAVFGRLLDARGGTAAGPADMVAITTAVRGGLSPWVVGLVAAGAVSAAFSTVAGLLITAAASLSHDIYYRLIDPRAEEARKVLVAKVSVLVLALLITFLALDPRGLIAEITAVAFALAGNTIFPAFLLGIWWSRANRQGVIAGMTAGIAVTFAPLFSPSVAAYLPPTSSAVVGAPLVLLVIVLVSLCTPPPPERIRRFLAEEVHGQPG